MADNLVLNAGSGGASLKTDQLADLTHVQYVKLMDGTADGTGVVAADATYGLDVDVTRLPALVASSAIIGAVTQSGTWNVGTVTTLTGITNSVAVTGTFWQATQPVSLASSVAVTGTFWQATQPISAASLPLPTGAATSALQAGGLPAALGTGGGLKVDGSGTALPVSGTFWQATQPVSGTFYQATQPVSGTVTVGSITAGDNNIGNVDVATQPARAATTDTITAKLATDALHSGTTALTPKFANILPSGAGNTAIVAAVADKTIRVLSLFVVAGISADVYFNDGTANLLGSATKTIPLDNTGAAGSGGFSLGFNPLGWFQTAAVNRNMNLNSTTSDVTGCILYVEV